MNARFFSGLAVFSAALSVLPAQATELFALSATGQIDRVDSNAPGTVLSSFQTSGLAADQKLAGIDFRPATGQLYGLGVNAADGSASVYTVNLATGALTAVGGSAFTFTGLPTMGSLISSVALDFNPVADRLRVVLNGSLSYRVNQLNGTLVQADTTLTYAAGGTPNVTAVAYSNSFAGATSTTLYGYDYSRDTIVTIGGPSGSPSPNGGMTFTIGNSGIVTSFDTIGFEIVGNQAFLLASESGGGKRPGTDGGPLGYQLYSVDLTTGAVTLIGAFGDSFSQYLSVTAVPVPEPTTTALAAAGVLGLALARRRRQSLPA